MSLARSSRNDSATSIGLFKSDQNKLLLNEISKLKTDLLALQNKLLDNKIYLHEYESRKINAGKNEPEISSQNYQVNIIDQFHSICDRYNQLKISLQKIIPEKEINEIEYSIFEVAEIGEEELNKLLYFPACQIIHENDAAKYADQLQKEVNEMEKHRNEVDVAYKNRSNDYKDAYEISGFLAMSVAMIPFAIIISATTGVINGIDKLIVTAKLAHLNNKKDDDSGKIDRNFYPEMKMLDDEINSDQGFYLKQQFFLLAKCRYQQFYQNIDNNIALPDCGLRK